MEPVLFSNSNNCTFIKNDNPRLFPGTIDTIKNGLIPLLRVYSGFDFLENLLIHSWVQRKPTRTPLVRSYWSGARRTPKAIGESGWQTWRHPGEMAWHSVLLSTNSDRTFCTYRQWYFQSEISIPGCSLHKLFTKCRIPTPLKTCFVQFKIFINW